MTSKQDQAKNSMSESPMSENQVPKTKCGTVSIIGRPNVGKSTLLNHLVGYKISAIANKPQTTRTNIRGIVTELATKDEAGYQIIFTDTPGIHLNSKNLLNFK